MKLNKTTLLIIFYAVFFLAAIWTGHLFVNFIYQQEKPSESELLAGVDDIIKYNEVNDIQLKNNDIVDNGKLIAYEYITKEIERADTLKATTTYQVNGVKTTKYIEAEEDIAKRTPDSKTYVIDAKNNVYATQFAIGNKWAMKNGEWYKVNTATTTKEVFDNEVKESISEKLINFIFNPTFAQTTSTTTANSANDTLYYTWSTLSQAAWDTAHHAATAAGQYGASNGYNAAWMRCAPSGTTKYLFRTFDSFDTSGLPDDATISSGYLYWKESPDAATADGINDSYAYISWATGSPASAPTIALSDFGYVGATKVVSEDKDISSISNGAWYRQDLNATGIAWVSKTGYTTFVAMEGRDIMDYYYTCGSQVDSSSFFSATGSYFTSLTVVYTTGGGGSVAQPNPVSPIIIFD